MPQHILEADSILLEFGTRRILSDIYIKAETGKIIGLLGRNGEGKTCLLNIILGSLKPLSRSIRFDEQFIPNIMMRKGLVAYLPQFSFIPKSLSINRLFNDFEIDKNHFLSFFPDFKTQLDKKFDYFSGGERRLIEVYCIIKAKAAFAILDEPFSHIMPLHIEVIKEVILEAKIDKGFIITDHMYRHITDIQDRLYVLKNGKTHLIKNIQEIEDLGYARI